MEASIASAYINREYIKKVSFLANRNESKMLATINADDAMRRLLERFISGDSSSEEKERLRTSLIDVLQQLPSLKTVILPKTVLPLSILFEILPKSITGKG